MRTIIAIGGAAATTIMLASSTASAQPDLRLRRPPVELRMRYPAARVAAADPPATEKEQPTPAPAADVSPLQLLIARQPRTDEPERTLAERLIFRLDLGFGVDGSGLRAATPATAVDPSSYDTVRAYGFGNLYAGSHGIGAPWLSSYLATNVVLASGSVPVLPWVRDQDDFAAMTSSAWVEIEDISTRAWLAPLRVRAGRQWVYGTSIAHFEGVLASWDSQAVQAQTYSGTRTSDYRPGDTVGDALVGADVRVDLGPLLELPMVVEAGALRLGDHRHASVALAWRPSPRLIARGSARALDGNWARERAELRVRISDVTTLSIDVTQRSADDWRWDLASVAVDDATEARGYLQLGATRPRLAGNLRAGTVLLDNIDLLLRAGGAADVGSGPPHATSPSWAEIGGAFEVRVRRAIALGASALARAYGTRRQYIDDTAAPDVLPPMSDVVGDRGMIEAGINTRYSGGARRFNAAAELYFRTTDRQAAYSALGPTPRPIKDLTYPSYGGGRFSLDGWIRPTLRVRAEYDLSTEIEAAPEIFGAKALRISMEGSF